MLGKIDALLSEKLSSVEWGEYKLEDLFDIVGTKSLDSNAITFVKSGINFVGRTFENNGIQGKIDLQNFAPNNPYTITATVIGNYKYVKYQKEPYYCSQNINKLTPKSTIAKWNEKIAYFFVTNIQKFVSLYDNQQGGYKLQDIKNHIVNVPIKDNKIDFDFMETLINEIENARISEIDSYLQITGLDNYELTEEEKNALREYENVFFKEYNVTEIFDIKNTKCILSRDIKENSGIDPYLCASSENNSVASYITYNENLKDPGNCIFIGGKTFVVSYQEKDFYSNDSHNLALYMKQYETKKYNQLYLSTCVEKSLSYKYCWGNSVSNSKIKKDLISLPTKNQKVDYENMELFISAISKLVIKDVVLYKNKKIELTKKLAEKNELKIAK